MSRLSINLRVTRRVELLENAVSDTERRYTRNTISFVKGTEAYPENSLVLGKGHLVTILKRTQRMCDENECKMVLGSS